MLNKYIFLGAALLVALVLLIFVIKVATTKTKTTKSILIAMICGLVDIPVYSITVISQDYTICYIAFTLNLLLVEWLTFYFLKFIYNYSGRKNDKIFKVLFAVTVIDLVVLVGEVSSPHAG